MGKLLEFKGKDKSGEPPKKAEVFGDKYRKIKTSLERINRLMAELKAESAKHSENSPLDIDKKD